MITILQVKKELKKLANPKKAKDLQWFFKTGKGEYGEGDIFLGITVPKLRATAKKYNDISFVDIKKLITSKYHEERFIALLFLTHKFETDPKKVFDFYLKNAKHINNWDLVDVSAHKIVGAYLVDKKRDVLYKLAKSKLLWERRIAIIATFWFINRGDFKDATKLATLLVKDEHDLMHKAVGWVMREVGKQSLKTEEAWLKKYYKTMPRTMLRYAIEKFPESKRKKYLEGKI